MEKAETNGVAPPLLTLVAQQAEEGEVAATVPVGWCVTDALIDEIQRRGFIKPQLILVVRSLKERNYGGQTFTDHTETGCVVVPLTQGLAYVNFSQPGVNEIIPIVVDMPDGAAAKQLHNIRRGKTRHLLSDAGLPVSFEDSPMNGLKHIKTGFTMDVVVPEQMFAPEPAAWRRRLVSRFYHERQQDQCHFRREFILSLLWIGPYAVIGVVFMLLSLIVGVLATKRRLKPHHILHPLDSEWSGVWCDVSQGGTYMWHDERGNQRPKYFRVYNHLAFFALPFVFSLFLEMSYWRAFLVVNGLLYGLALLAAIGLFVIALVGKVLDSTETKSRKAAEARLELEARRKTVRVELASMVCNGRGAPTSLDELPADKRTIFLRYYRLKTRVCRQFAR